MIPAYRWGFAPPELATRAQLRAEGLRPGGQDPVAELLWRSRRARGGYRRAWLYDRTRAAAVRPITPARERALARALLARHTCNACQQVFEYCLPTSTGGLCPPCDADEAARVLADEGWAA